jgi:kinesin family protein C1
MASSSLKAATSVLKRKLASEMEDHPRKLPAIASSGAERPNQPLRDQTRNTNNVSSSRLATKPPALTVPKPPILSTTRSKRANSAPPKSVGQLGLRASTRNAVDAKPARRNASGTLGPKNKQGVDDKRFRELENQLASIEEARAEANAKLAAEIEAERSKAAELYTNLQANQAVLSRALATAKTQELNQRRDLVDASDEIENLRKKHQREVMDLEMDLKKRDREIRELDEDLRVQRSDLERERETVSTLKSTIAQLSNSELSVTTQKNALQSQIHALQAMLDDSTSSVSQLRLMLEAEQKKVEKLEQEAREAEGVRRKLHNMVQELKGNIRVFCRVRPILSSDSATPALGSSSGRNNESLKLPSSVAEEKGVVGDEIGADISFPDRQDHKEIVIYSSSESAMGQERKEAHNFSFDRVRV